MKKFYNYLFGLLLATNYLVVSMPPYHEDNNFISHEENISYAKIGDSDVNNLYNSLVAQQSDVIIDDYYAGVYFNNLNSNFGNNAYGSCTYVSIGMLLSFYDSYWDDSFIPEQYDVNAYFQSTLQQNADFEFPPFDVDSPGIMFESNSLVSNLNMNEYLNVVSNNSNTYFQFKLIQLGKSLFGNEKFDNSTNPLGMTHSELISFLNYYLFTYRSMSSSNVLITSENSNSLMVRNYTISKIRDGIPVILRAKKIGTSNSGHSFIAYDYDENNNEIYVHTGWRDEMADTALTHVSLSDLGYTDLWDATTIEPQTDYAYPKNYLSSNGSSICSSNYIFPQSIRITAGNHRDEPPTYEWKSLCQERWSAQYNPYFKLSILKNNKQILFSITTNNKEYTLSNSQWNNVLNIDPGNYYYVYLELVSNSYFYWDDYWSIESFSKPKDFSSNITYINPDEYGFADAYPTDTNTENNYITHNVRGVSFETRRYRTGYIHNEYIVMSPIRNGINRAFIEYKFATPIEKIEVELSHWREYSSEGLNSDNGTATIDAYIDGNWITKFDMLSSAAKLSIDRTNPKFYTINFGTPVYNFRFYSTSNNINTNNNNRGRICIGTLAVFPWSQNVSDKSSTFSNAQSITFESSYVESFQTSTDIDYFKYYADYTNYIQFNIQSMWNSGLCNIDVYSSANLFTPIYSYTNQDSILGSNITNIPAIYAEQGTTYYFKISQYDETLYHSKSFYTATVLSGNYADCDSSQFLNKGYVSSLKYVYNGSNNIYVYFDESAYETTNSGITYKSIVLDAMAIWNDVGRIQCVEVDNKNQADTIVYSYYDSSDNWVAYYNSIYYTSSNEVFSGTLNMNKYRMNSYDYAKNLFACVHELGHGLGLGHINYNGIKNVMNSYVGSYTKLGQGDLAAYRYLWG